MAALEASWDRAAARMSESNNQAMSDLEHGIQQCLQNQADLRAENARLLDLLSHLDNMLPPAPDATPASAASMTGTWPRACGATGGAWPAAASADAWSCALDSAEAAAWAQWPAYQAWHGDFETVAQSPALPPAARRQAFTVSLADALGSPAKCTSEEGIIRLAQLLSPPEKARFAGA